MKIKAKSLIIEFDEGQMVVINPGETGELSDAKAESKIAEGAAIRVGRLPQLDHDGNGRPGGSKPKAAASALGDARKRYKAAFGKAAGPRWTVEHIEAKIAGAGKVVAKTAEVEGAIVPGGSTEDDAPPAE